jgi:PAP2 superfamily
LPDGCATQRDRGGSGVQFAAGSADVADVTDLALAPEWVCVGCRGRVPMAADVCPSCGRAFAEGLRSDQPPGHTLARWVKVVRELVVLNILFVVWRVVGGASVLHISGAFSRGRTLWNAERWLHLPNEAALQRMVLPHATFARICNGYYAWAHAPLLALTLIWLLWRHREAYPRWRTLVVVFTGLSLLIGFLPIAPPRLVPGLGLVDLADRYHQSVYGAIGSGFSDQLSSVPSVHIGWAVIVAAAVIGASRSRWRWFAVLHPLITLYVVVVTANHYWLDAVFAVVLLALIEAVRRWLLARRPSHVAAAT